MRWYCARPTALSQRGMVMAKHSCLVDSRALLIELSSDNTGLVHARNYVYLKIHAALYHTSLASVLVVVYARCHRETPANLY